MFHNVAQSVISGVFNESLCAGIEEHESTAPATIEKLAALFLAPDRNVVLEGKRVHVESLSPEQLGVLFQYLKRFSKAFTQESFSQWQSCAIRLLETRDHVLRRSLSDFLLELLARDHKFRQKLLIHTLRQPFDLATHVWTCFCEQHARDFFTIIDSCIRQTETRNGALKLMTVVLQKQGSHLSEVLHTTCLETMIALLKQSTERLTLSLALTSLTMLLPSIGAALHSYIRDMIDIAEHVVFTTHFDNIAPRQAQSNLAVDHWHQVITEYLRHVYGLFPCHFVEIFRNKCPAGTKLRSLIEPYLIQIPLNPRIMDSMESEADPKRWRNESIRSCIDWSVHNYKAATVAPAAQQGIDSSANELRTQLDWAQAEIALQKYLRHQLSEELRLIQRSATLAADAIRGEGDQADMVAMLKAEIRSLRDVLAREREGHNDTKAQHLKWEGDLKKNLSKLHEERSRLAQHNVDINQRAALLSLKLEETNHLLAQALQSNTEQEARIHQLEKALHKVKDQDQLLQRLKEHAIMRSELLTSSRDLEHSYDDQKHKIQSLTLQLHAQQEELRDEKKTVASLRSQLVQTESERERLHAALEYLEKSVAKHREMTAHKEELLDHKYKTIKAANALLETEFFKRKMNPDYGNQNQTRNNNNNNNNNNSNDNNNNNSNNNNDNNNPEDKEDDEDEIPSTLSSPHSVIEATPRSVGDRDSPIHGSVVADASYT